MSDNVMATIDQLFESAFTKNSSASVSPLKSEAQIDRVRLAIRRFMGQSDGTKAAAVLKARDTLSQDLVASQPRMDGVTAERIGNAIGDITRYRQFFQSIVE